MTAYPELRPCTDCLRVTRPKCRKANEYPFPTYARGNSKYCCRCYDQNRLIPAYEKALVPMADPLTDPGLAQTMRGYLRYLAGRQQRLARTRQVQTT